MRPRLQQLRQTTELDAVIALQRVDGGAEFMVPPPTNADRTIAEDFAAVTDTPADAREAALGRARTRMDDGDNRRVVVVAEGMLLVPSSFVYLALAVLDSREWHLRWFTPPAACACSEG